MTAPPEVQALATTVTNLVVSPSVGGVSITYTTNTAVRGQLQIGTASGTYPNKFTLEAVARINHQCSGYNLAANTTYHYVLQFYDQSGTILDATADATFTTLAVPTTSSGSGVIIGTPGQSLIGGYGVPPASLGNDGSFYFRWDGAAGALIYHRVSGAWVATAA